MKKISILHENMQTCKPDDYYIDVIAAPPSRKVNQSFCRVDRIRSSLPIRHQTVSNREIEVQTEDEQTFLARQQQAIQQGTTPHINRTDSPSRPPVSASSKTPRASVSAPLPVAGIFQVDMANLGAYFGLKLDPNRQINTPGGEGVLANFFNSLLNKKTGTPGSPASLGSVGGGGSAGGLGSQTSSPRGGGASLNGGGPPGTPDSMLLSDKMTVRNDAAAELERLTRTVSSSVKREMDFSQSDC